MPFFLLTQQLFNFVLQKFEAACDITDPHLLALWGNAPEILIKIHLSNIAFTWGKYFFLNIFLLFPFLIEKVQLL